MSSVNQNHFQVLTKGADFWNEARKGNPLVEPDLCEADLRRAVLNCVNFTETNLNRANLSRAKFREVDFTGANLIEADLRGAEFDHACLIGANLTKANLTGAHFVKVDFSKANFTEANLAGTNLGGELLGGLNFAGANLCQINLSWATLTEANLSHSNLAGANLTDAKLNQADLRGTNLNRAILIGSDLKRANLSEADLRGANLTEANLNQSNLTEASLNGVNLTNACLTEAKLCRTNLIGTNLCRANLSRADMSGARIIEANLKGANLTGCTVFGISAWGLIGLKEAEQSNLVITHRDEPAITVDNLEVAQFIYILLHSEKIRSVIDALTSKVVLILGRFTPERKAILDAIRDALRKRNYLPILFDFEKPASRNLTETVSTLAHMSRFVIADITEPRSIPQELGRIIPNLSSVPIQPILLSSAQEYGMFVDFKNYPWVLDAYYYNDKDDLLNSLGTKVIAPAEQKAKQLQKT